MEDIGQYYGFTLYSTVVDGPRDEAEMKFDAVHDRAVVFIDGENKGYYERSRDGKPVSFSLKKGEKCRIDILCENMGRVNYGTKIMDRKGVKGVRFNLQYHFGWDMYPLPLDNISSLEFSHKAGEVKVASFLKGTLKINGEPHDTFIRLDGFTKGVVFVNGFNIGRYFNPAGPQKTLYVPAPMLRNGDNEIVVFETDYSDRSYVTFLDKPDLG